MNINRFVLHLFILYVIFTNVEAVNVKEFFKKIFSPLTNKTTTTSTTERSINIVIARRDVTGTIRKRSVSGEEAAKVINTNKSPNTCSEDQLMVYLAEIQAINPESIINLSTYDEMIVICRQVSDSLDKIDKFLKSCQIANDKSLYIQLIKGVDKLYSVLCDEKASIRKDFQKFFPCLKQLHDDFETCFGPPDWTENLSKSEICKSYKDIADCYYIKAAKVCGKPAAKVMKSLVKAVVDAIIPVHCTSVRVNPRVDLTDVHHKRSSQTPDHKLVGFHPDGIKYCFVAQLKPIKYIQMINKNMFSLM